MATTDAVPARVLAKTREICLGLPDTKETMTWGKPHFRVGEKIFAGCGEENGKPVIGFKLEMEHAAAIIRDPRFWRAPYVGHKGWVSMDAGSVKNWDEVQAMIIESFCLIAPKRTVAKLDEWAVASPAKKATRKRARATKKVAKVKVKANATKKTSHKTTKPPSRKSASKRPSARRSR